MKIFKSKNMITFYNVFIFVAVLIFIPWEVQSQCTSTTISDLKGTFSYSHVVSGTARFLKCWRILNPSNVSLKLEIEYLNLTAKVCDYAHLRITEKRTGKNIDLCSSLSMNTITVYSDVDVSFNISNGNFKAGETQNFKINLNNGKVPSQCIEISDVNGTFTNTTVTSGTQEYSECWIIKNPSNLPLKLDIEYLEFPKKRCLYAYLRVTDKWMKNAADFCDNVTMTALSFNSEAEVNFYFWNEKFDSGATMKFKINFNIDIGLGSADKKAIQWLLNKRSLLWGWKDKNPEALIALYLSSAFSFNGTDCLEESMVKEAKLNVANSLLQKSVSNEVLSTLINAMLVSCNNPRRIFGQDLVNRLYNQIEKSINVSPHPVAYLALCNANMSWPRTASNDLTKIFTSESGYAFVKDIQAFAAMAVSCRINQTDSFKTDPQNSNLISLYENTIKKFKQSQLADNSFGKVHTTALLTQALMASGQQSATDWNVYGAINFLRKAMHSSEDFLAVYLSLPIFNQKTFVDIHKINCTGNPRNPDGILTEIEDYTGRKMRVKYSLYIGDKKEMIHSISLQVPRNFTGYQVMQYAATQDPKYQFKWEKISGKMHVYDISKMPDDPISGKFWLLYFKSASNNKEGELTNIGPDELILSDEDHLVMWYKSATIL